MKLLAAIVANKDAITELSRPFAIYASGIAVAIGIFVPSVTADKLLVAAGVVGATSYLRSQDKRLGVGNG